jgi:hypothetical protein
MKTQWNDETITKALRKMAKAQPHPAVFEKTWTRIEDRLSTPRKGHLVWKPWNHSVRWIAVAACLCLVLTGVLYHQGGAEDEKMASYIMKVSNTTSDMTRDQNMVKVSTLLSEPASPAPEMTDEVHIDALSSDEIFL